MKVRKMNGFTLIGHRFNGLRGDSGFIIVACRQDGEFYEFVTALAETPEADHWFNGHYFSTRDF